MKFLICGLGNIGDEYANTRHNIGFLALDVLAKQANVSFSLSRYAFTAEMRHKGRSLFLIKPTTYVNLSGKAVKYWLEKEKIPVENLLIIVDDIALDTGKIRIKKSGNDGGHNGLIHISEMLQTNDYARLRLGIGSNFAKGHQVDYVLGKITKEEEEILIPKLEMAAEAIKSFATIGIDRTMNFFNNK